MPTSADPTRRQAGFTLLEVMVTVAVVALFVLPLLQIREQASARAYRSSRMLMAMDHAEQLLQGCMLTAQEYDRYEAPVEDDPNFRYVLSLEEFDVSTGLTAKESDERADEQAADANFNDFGSSVPSDAATNQGEEEEEDRDDPHRVRRYRIQVLWPSWDDERDDQDAWDDVLIEGYLPMVWEKPEQAGDETP